MSEILHPCVTYGISHSKRYEPSVVADVLIDYDSDGVPIKMHSDAYLLLHQKNLQKQIGSDVLRDYFDRLARSSSELVDTSKLSDDQLFDLIPPKAVNNLTTRYEYSRYLEEHEKEMKSQYKKLHEAHKKQDELDRWIKGVVKLSDKDDNKSD